jgi:hypothetical protein
VPREGKHFFNTSMLQLLVGRKGKSSPLQLTGLQAREGGDAEKEFAEDTQDYNRKGVLFQSHHSTFILHGSVPRQDRERAAASGTSSSSDSSCHNGTESPCTLLAPANRSVRAPNVNSLPLDNMLEVVTAVQQIIT